MYAGAQDLEQGQDSVQNPQVALPEEASALKAERRRAGKPSLRQSGTLKLSSKTMLKTIRRSSPLNGR